MKEILEQLRQRRKDLDEIQKGLEDLAKKVDASFSSIQKHLEETKEVSIGVLKEMMKKELNKE